MHFSTRLQRFAYARLLASYLTGSGPAFSSTLTTIALYDSSLRWFEARSRKLASRGLSLISCAARLLWKCLTHSSSFAPSWRTLIKMPGGVGLGSTFAQVRRDFGPEMIHPAPNGLVGDHDASFCQQVFDVTEAQCEPEIEPDRLLDDLWRKAVAAIADFLHSLGYRTASGTASSKYRDSALTSLRSRAAFIGCRSFECRSRYDVKAPEIIGHSVSVPNCGGNAHAYERPRCAKVRISAFATLTLLIYTPLLLRMHVVSPMTCDASSQPARSSIAMSTTKIPLGDAIANSDIPWLDI
jgi:hypothetical protein